MAPLTLTYLAIKPLGGRGGTLRFFMQIHGLDFDEEMIPMAEWGAAKANMIETKENPCGTVPIVKMNDDENVPVLIQHIAICRYLFRTKICENEPVHAWQEMVQDMIADEYHAWRGAWVSTLGSPDVAAAYKAEQLPNYLKLFNALYEKYATAEPYLSTTSAGKPLWGDVAVASLVYDSIQTGAIAKDDLKVYPKIDALYDGFCAIPAVAAWIDPDYKIEL